MQHRHPSEIERYLAEAREVIIAVEGGLSGDLLAALKGREKTETIILLREPETLDHLKELIAAGFHVFSAAIPKGPGHIILDRRQGYRLPSWEEIPDVRREAHRLLWRRTAYFDAIQGTVERTEGGRAFILAEFPNFRIFLSRESPALVLPPVGQRLQIAVCFPFGASLLPPYLLYALEISSSADDAT
ncbi:MAG: hypothetical protein HYX89_04465 [Chloroflexi bacterium]|nr:hypothetical protein [Chloroflexota bacterium]